MSERAAARVSSFSPDHAEAKAKVPSRLLEEADILSLSLAKLHGKIDLLEFKAVPKMLHKVCLLKSGWETDVIKTVTPPKRCRALRHMLHVLVTFGVVVVVVRRGCGCC